METALFSYARLGERVGAFILVSSEVNIYIKTSNLREL